MPTLAEIEQRLSSMASMETKASIEKFVPHSQKVYGVKMPVINELAVELKEQGFSLVNKLWESGAFEEKILAAKLVGKLSKKFPEQAIDTVKEFSNDVKDWAVCDTLGMQSLKPIAAKYQKEIFSLAKQLNSSEDFWQRRLSLVLVEVYSKDPALHEAIQRLIKRLENDKEYYVKKAVVWLKRSMEKHIKAGRGVK